MAARSKDHWIASSLSFIIGPAEGGTRWLLARTVLPAAPQFLEPAAVVTDQPDVLKLRALQWT
jgi:hypothetical protein